MIDDPNSSAYLDFTGMDWDELTGYSVGDLMGALRTSDFRHRPNISAVDLMRLAHVGKSMLFEAILIADRQGNEDFFEGACSFYGSPLINAALEEMNLRTDR